MVDYARHLEWCKSVALKSSEFNFDEPCALNDVISEIHWCVNNIEHSFKAIRSTPEIDKVIHTDASNGHWSLLEQDRHINISLWRTSG